MIIKRLSGLKRGSLIGLILSLTCLCAFPADAKKPTVKAVRVKDKIEYAFVPENQTNCDKSGAVHLVGAKKTAGCTTSINFIHKADVDCNKKSIRFSLGYSKYLVQIVDKYKPKTIEFDKIVKHELTHVRLHQKTAEKFYQPIGQALLMQYEKSEKKGKSCYEIKNDIFNLFYRYAYKYKVEDEKQQALIDGKENYAYQNEQVWKAKLFLTPRVKMSERKTEYISSSGFDADFGYRHSFDINGDVPVFSLELMPIVQYSSRVPKDGCRFKAGMKYAENKLERRRKVFHQIAQELKSFLPEAFKKASQTKSEYDDIRKEGWEAAGRMISDRLEKAVGEATEENFFAACEPEERQQRELERAELEKRREFKRAEYEKQKETGAAEREKQKRQQIYVRNELKTGMQPVKETTAELSVPSETGKTVQPSPEINENADETVSAGQFFSDASFNEPRQIASGEEEGEAYSRAEEINAVESKRSGPDRDKTVETALSPVSDCPVRKRKMTETPEMSDKPETAAVEQNGIDYYLTLLKNIVSAAVEEFELKEKFDRLKNRFFGSFRKNRVANDEKRVPDPKNGQAVK